MKAVVDKAKENPWLLMVPLLFGGTGTLAKFGIFDPLTQPMYSIIYHQKISIFMADSMSYLEARTEAEYQMLKHWKWQPRGVE